MGLAVVLGHIWSPFLKGQGGKGVATSLGAILAVEPWFALLMLVVFGLLLWRTRWVAGASISACLVLLLLGLGAWLGWVPAGTRNTGAWCVVLALIVTFRHRRNIELWVAARRAVVHTLTAIAPPCTGDGSHVERGSRLPSVPVCRCAAARRTLPASAGAACGGERAAERDGSGRATGAPGASEVWLPDRAWVASQRRS